MKRKGLKRYSLHLFFRLFRFIPYVPYSLRFLYHANSFLPLQIASVILLRAVILRPFDDQRRHLLAHRQPRVNIAAVMDAGPDSRSRGFHRKVSDEFRVAGEQVGQYFPLPAGERGMRRWVARMIGIREQRRDRRIELTRADRPVGILG